MAILLEQPSYLGLAPTSTAQVRELLPFLNRLAYHFVTSMPDQVGYSLEARESCIVLVGPLIRNHAMNKHLRAMGGFYA